MTLARTLGRNTVRLGRGLKPAVRPLAIGGGTAGALYFGRGIVSEFGDARNPELQLVDLDGDGNPDLAYNRESQRPLGFGPHGKPTYEGDPDGNDDRDKSRLFMLGVLGLAGLGAVILLKGGK